MIEINRVKENMRVKVVAVPDDSPDYTSCLNKFGIIKGEPYCGDTEELEWVMVLLDGEKVPCEFKLSELEAIDNVFTVNFNGIAKKYANGVFVGDLWSGAIPGVEFQEGEEISVTVNVTRKKNN